MEGDDVGAIAKRVGPFPIADACEIVRQTALGLQHAHEHDLVHRDIKPTNLLLTTTDPPRSRSRETSDPGARETSDLSSRSRSRETSDPTARTLTSSATPSPTPSTCTIKILDLGLALLHGDQPGDELTSTGQVMGTLDYIAPEQLADTHGVDIRADLYSLGCTLFRLIAGEPPFSSATLNTAAKKMFAHSFTPPPKLIDRRSDVPPELSALVDRLLAKKPDERFATPSELATALAPFCVGHNLPALLHADPIATPSDPFASTIVPANVAITAPRDEPRATDAESQVGWVESS